MILAPIFRRASEGTGERVDDGEARSVVGFHAVYVFDVTQTDGAPLLEIGSVNGDPGSYRERLEQFVQQQSITLEYSVDIAPARGMSEGGKITLLLGQTPAETVATLVHELAHERLHRTERRTHMTKSIRETEAEAVAFVVCQAIGLETGTASADYISLWNGDAAVLLESLEIVQRTATEIITAIRPDESVRSEGEGMGGRSWSPLSLLAYSETIRRTSLSKTKRCMGSVGEGMKSKCS